MLAIELKLNLFVLAGIVLSSFFLGFMFRRNRINSFKQKVIELEKEMLNNHADILELQKQKAHLEQNLQASKIPVIPLNPKEEGGDNKALRK